MPLTLAQIDALLADNSAGDISAADMRAVARAILHWQRAPYSVDNAADVWWEGNIGSFTTVTVTGSQTVTEKDGFLSVDFTGQSASDLNAALKAHTFTIGDSFACKLSCIGIGLTMAALVFTDGTTSAANVVAGFYNYDGNAKAQAWTGTLTNVATNSWGDIMGTFWSGLFVKVTYTAANTFRVEYSADGVSWSLLNHATISFTMTPTHFGVAWSKWGQLSNGSATFGPICKLT